MWSEYEIKQINCLDSGFKQWGNYRWSPNFGHCCRSGFSCLSLGASINAINRQMVKIS